MPRVPQQSLLSKLVRPVVRAMARAGFTQQELLTGPLQYTDLVWQSPPLIAEAPLEGVPLHLYLERHFTINVQRLYSFWDDALLHMRNSPYKVIEGGAYRQTSYVLPRSQPGVRAYWFSIPEGFPGSTSDYAGVALSLECAHLLRYSAPITEVVEDEDNYYVRLKEGHLVGVRDGLPILHADQWDIDVKGQVSELLRTPRGAAFVGCDYDLISKLRSALWERREAFKDFDGVDYALQTMRVLANGQHVGELAQAISRLQLDRKREEHRVSIVQDALHLAKLPTISDRARVMFARCWCRTSSTPPRSQSGSTT
jgi:hypothetical protein